MIPVAVAAGLAGASEVGVGGTDQQLAGDDLARLRLQPDGGEAHPHILDDIAGADQRLVEGGTGRIDVLPKPGHRRIAHGVLGGLAQRPPGVALPPMPQDAERPAATAVVVHRDHHESLPAKLARRRHVAENAKVKGSRGGKCSSVCKTGTYAVGFPVGKADL